MVNILLIASIDRRDHASHNESTEAPLLSCDLVLNEVIGTTGYAVHSIVAAHDAGNIALPELPHACKTQMQGSMSG